MEQIHAPGVLFSKLLGKQKIKTNTKYKTASYCLRDECDEGSLLLNVLTGELLLLCGDEDRERLIEGRFLIPEEQNELEFIDECRELEKLLDRKKETGYRSFTILTTTDCNARCPYCYEQGCEKLTMDEKTALATVDFINRKRNREKEISLNWFGGEPLLNTAVIDTISAELTKRGIPFSSGIITNGFLFDADLVKRAKSEWKLSFAQITLDGTAELYNKTKGFVYSDVSNAFERVLENIALLADSGIRVSVRMNLTGANGYELEKLCNLLAERYRNHPCVRPYVRAIFQQQDRMDVRAELEKLKAIIRESFPVKNSRVKDQLIYSHCGADSDDVVLILPNGDLHCCEHFTEQPQTFGSVFSEEIDEENRRWWKEKEPWGNDCASCVYAPRCLRLAHCPSAAACYEEDRMEHLERLRNEMRTEYACWRATSL